MSRKLTLDLIFPENNNNNISNLTSLNLAGKNINDISILSKFPSLEILSLAKNQIKDLSVFKNLKNLKILNLKDNKISEFNQLEPLKNCNKLESLILKDNSISKEQNYIQKIKELLPQLKKLDEIEINKNTNNKENIKVSIKADSKKIDKLNMITNKFIKFKGQKNKSNTNPFNPNDFKASPSRQNNQKLNNDINNKINSSGKKENKEKKNSNNNSNKKNSDEKDNEIIDKKVDNNNNKNENNNIPNDDDFEIININAEKKKLENQQKIEDKDKHSKNKELLSYSFKKKKTAGIICKFSKKNKDRNNDVNTTLDNIKIDNQLINRFNDENKNLNYSYSKKIIGGFNPSHNMLSQSIRYDDENDDDNNEMRFSQKNKLYSIKNRLLNQIYNRKINNNSIKINENDNEKVIVKSIKLLLGNLNEEELNQINNDIINAISKINK